MSGGQDLWTIHGCSFGYRFNSYSNIDFLWENSITNSLFMTSIICLPIEYGGKCMKKQRIFKTVLLRTTHDSIIRNQTVVSNENRESLVASTTTVNETGLQDNLTVWTSLLCNVWKLVSFSLHRFLSIVWFLLFEFVIVVENVNNYAKY